ncbi:MAG: RDD family protein, partial [Terracidiphilus sp.]
AAVAAAGQRLEIRWEPDMPARPAGPPAAPGLHESQEFEAAEENWWTAAGRSAGAAANQPIEPVEPVQPIHANLIEFPRELVATRRMRPRLTRAEHDETGDLFGQLSIFEVDPSAISIEPEAPTAEAEVQAPAWNGAEWSGIELDEQPDEDAERQGELAPALHLASFGLRLMATAVDAALIAGAACAVVAEAAHHMQHPPGMKAAELGAMAALLVAGVVYYAVFFALSKSTPGMKYARISLCTFDDEIPTPAQLRGRLGAMLLSLLPVGLGVAWAIFDDDHLTWHDRLSRTYPRKD